MNRRIGTVLVAAVVIGGVLVAGLPQHAASIARVLATAVAVLTGTMVLRAVAPVVAREPMWTALDRRPRLGAPALDPHGLRDARRDLDRPAPAGSVPAAVAARLHAMAGRAGVTVQVPGEVPGDGAGPATRDPAGVARRVSRLLDTIDRPPRSGAEHDHH